MITEFLVALIWVGVATCDDKHTDVRYSGPVVYTNLPPPLLYFPSFPDKQTISDRGDGGQRIEYVPFPYKDLPLLVYQSDQQPPVHVVQKGKDEQDGHQKEEEAGDEEGPTDDKASDDQGEPPTSGHQFISIGLSSVQPQTSGRQGQGNVQQYVQAHQVRFAPQNPGPTGPAYAFYPAQQSQQTGQSQQRVPADPLRQVVQSYASAQGAGQRVKYEEGQTSFRPTGGDDTPTQHVGITIIHHPEGGPQASVQQHVRPENQGGQQQQLFDGHQQFVSIGLFPIQIPGGDPKQLYNVMAPVQSNQYPEGGANVQQSYPSSKDYDQGNQQQSEGDVYSGSEQPYQDGTDEYAQPNQQQYAPQGEDFRMMNPQYPPATDGYGPPNPQKPPAGAIGPQTSGYQVISIDLSTLTNQNAAPPSNTNPVYIQPPRAPVAPVQNENEMENAHRGNGKEYQQILIQIPNNIAEQATHHVHGMGPNVAPYTGTAQSGNAARGARKPYNVPNRGPVYGRPTRGRPPQNNYLQEKPPRSVQGPSQNGLLGNGINIAIIKQADTSSQFPAFQPPSSGANAGRIPSQPPPNGHRGRSPHGLIRPSSQTYPGQRVVTTGRPLNVPSGSLKNIQQNVPPAAQPYQGQRMQASSNLHYTAVHLNGSRPHQVPGQRLQRPAVQSSAPKTYAKLLEAPRTNGFEDVSFDDINAFLSPSYDLFGDKKAAKDDIQFLQAIAGDILEPTTHVFRPVPQPFAAPRPAPVSPAPFPYRYWEQTVYGPRLAGGQYSHMQHPHVRGGKPLPVYGRGQFGYRGLKRKLSSLIRGKSKIAPRQEEDVDGVDLAALIAKNLGVVLPRSGTQKPSLDGISIPLRSHSTSRASEDEDDGEGASMKAPLPPIIVYKGSKPPVEIHGSKGDIETDNKTGTEKAEEPHPAKKSEEPQEAKKSSKPEKSGQAMSERRTGYLDYMYSVLPELLIGSLSGRYESQWLPVGPTEYSDTYDRNETTTVRPDRFGSPSYNSSAKGEEEASLKEDIEELFSLLGREEKMDFIRD